MYLRIFYTDSATGVNNVRWLYDTATVYHCTRTLTAALPLLAARSSRTSLQVDTAVYLV